MIETNEISRNLWVENLVIKVLSMSFSFLLNARRAKYNRRWSYSNSKECPVAFEDKFGNKYILLQSKLLYLIKNIFRFIIYKHNPKHLANYWPSVLYGRRANNSDSDTKNQPVSVLTSSKLINCFPFKNAAVILKDDSQNVPGQES